MELKLRTVEKVRNAFISIAKGSRRLRTVPILQLRKHFRDVLAELEEAALDAAQALNDDVEGRR